MDQGAFPWTRRTIFVLRRLRGRPGELSVTSRALEGIARGSLFRLRRAGFGLRVSANPRLLQGTGSIDRFDRQPISRPRAEPGGASRIGNRSERPGLLSPASRLRHTNPRGQVHGKRPVNHRTRKLARYRGRISLRLHPFISRVRIFPRVSIAKR